MSYFCAGESEVASTLNHCSRCHRLRSDLTRVSFTNDNMEDKYLCKDCLDEFMKSMFDFDCYFNANPKTQYDKIRCLMKRMNEHGFEEKKTESHNMDDREKTKRTLESIWPLVKKMADIDFHSGVHSSTYLTEESAELVVELGNLVKNLCKTDRQKQDFRDVEEEIVDVLVTCFTYLANHGLSLDWILGVMEIKLCRGIRRFEEEGEL